MTDDRLKNFIASAFDLEMRASDFLAGHPGAKRALVIALKNFGVANDSLRTAAFESLTGWPPPRPEDCEPKPGPQKPLEPQ